MIFLSRVCLFRGGLMSYLFSIFLLLSFCYYSFSQGKVGEESLFLNLQKVGLGQLSDAEEKKRFLDTVQIEKQKIQYKMLENIYENAYQFYKNGDYQSAKEMAARILSIDPNFEDAKMLKEASENLKGSSNPRYTEKVMMEDKFREAMSSYQDGNIAKAYKQMGDILKLSPNNIKAKYWYEKMRGDLKDYYEREAEKQYKAGNIKEALNNLYNALSIKPKDEKIIYKISVLEEEQKEQMVNDKLKSALEVYAKGDIQKAYKILQTALEINPGNNKANKLYNDVKKEIEDGYIQKGKSLYAKREYTQAISEWEKARPYSNDISYIGKLIERAKEQMAKEAEEKKRREEEAKKKAKEEEEKKKKKQMLGQDTGSSDDEQEALKKKKISEQNKQAAEQHYLNGLREFQNSNYQKAKDEWTIAKQLDPTYPGVEEGLKRIEQLLSGGSQ